MLTKKAVHFDQLMHWQKTNVNRLTSSNLLPDYLYTDIRCDSRDQGRAFILRSLQKQNGLVKRSKNNMKDIIGISIAYWRVHLRRGT